MTVPISVTKLAISSSVLHPLADRGLGQVEVFGDLAGGPVPALAQLDDLRLELSSERSAPPGLLPHALDDRTSFRGAEPQMVDVRQSG
jgi:hypothetical protein